MQIESVKENRRDFLDLLLLADPSEETVMKYLEQGELFLLREADQVYGLIHLFPHDKEHIEVKNIAVREDMQGKGYGKKLLRYAIDWSISNGYKKISIGTGNSGIITLMFYQKMGFRMTSIIRDFFVNNYSEPIIENGIPCRDMVMLEIDVAEYISQHV